MAKHSLSVHLETAVFPSSVRPIIYAPPMTWYRGCSDSRSSFLRMIGTVAPTTKQTKSESSTLGKRPQAAVQSMRSVVGIVAYPAAVPLLDRSVVTHAGAVTAHALQKPSIAANSPRTPTTESPESLEALCRSRCPTCATEHRTEFSRAA